MEFMLKNGNFLGVSFVSPSCGSQT